MHDAPSLHSADATHGTDPYAIYDQLPPVLAPTMWRRAFPTLTQLATLLRQNDARAPA